MAKNDLKVLGAWFSPYALRVQIALHLKGLDYEFVEETLDPKSELLLKSNPVHKKIPVLIHADKPICESAIIVQYIDELWTNSPSILPSNAYDRALARFWAAYIDGKWFEAMYNILTGEDEEAKRVMFVELEEGLERMEDVLNKHSEGKAYFGGDSIGFIDIVFGSFLGFFRVLEEMNGRIMLDEAKNPSLTKWAQMFAAHPAVKDVLPQTHKLVEFAKVFKQRMAAQAAT
ncbi:hypothetical protein VNO77_39973 [Canavalia gladiata]|uniref:glutathione transferase n=1 Tax=Canavalia gladiata TaxID=3824 RepID=A0AAN9JXD1_CANGL